MEFMHLFTYSISLSIVTYFIVWTINHASIFENLRDWAEASDTFIKRIVACPICITYHIALLAVGIPALLLTWNPGQWLLTWCITCCISLALYSRKMIKSFDDD